MLNKFFSYFFCKKKLTDKLLNKIIAISLVLFQAVFLLMLLDSDIFKVNAQSNEEEKTDPIILSFVGTFPATFSNDRIVNLSVNKPVESIVFYIENPVRKTFETKSDNSGLYYFTWQTKNFTNGKYILNAAAIIRGKTVASNTVEVLINNQESTITPLQKPISSSETNKPKDLSDEKQNTEFNQKISTGTDEINQISEECLNVGIDNNRDCLVFQNLDPLCKEKKITNSYQCNSYLNLNIKCRELNLNENECAIFLRLPNDCQNANITSQEQCQQYIYKNSLPIVCVNNNINNHEECNEYLALQALPAVCLKSGIKTKEKCREILADQEMPTECKNANINKSADCDIYLNLTKQKSFCSSLGINDENQCFFYYQNKNIAKECLDMGIINELDCDILLQKKYGQQMCALAGITDKEECAKYIFNKYKTQIKCNGLDDWRCQEIIETKWLGNIANKQSQYKELETYFTNLSLNKKLSVKDLELNLNTAKSLISLNNKNSGIKVIRMESKIQLTQDKSLIQTSPVGIMLDSDGDDLPDDFEKRIGTDPENNDTDQDGFLDSEEIKSGFNPLGQGLLLKVLTPIDLVIANNLTLEQPKTSGESSDEYQVNKIIGSDKDFSYSLSGKAEPNTIVTLYFYSDMPLLVTTQVDEFGNWQYNLKESLIDGEHEVYVALNDNTGRITKKSSPISFFIKEAKAVSVQDFVAGAPKNQTTKSESMLNFYFIVSMIIAVAGILMFIAFIMLRKNKNELDGDNS